MDLMSFEDFCREVGASQRTVTIALGRKGWTAVADPADRRRKGYPKNWVDPIKEEVQAYLLEQAQGGRKA